MSSIMQPLPTPFKRLSTRSALWATILYGSVLTSMADQVFARHAQPADPLSSRPAEQEPIPPAPQSCDDELAAVQKAATTEQRAIRLLNLARCRLVIQAAPALTAELHDRADHKKELRDLLSLAEKNLNEAEAQIEQTDKAGEDADTEALHDRDELLRTFHTMFAALAAFDDSHEARDRLIDACGDLSLFVDDSRKAVAESARCWQGLGYLRAGKPERAIQVLRPMLTPPSAGRLGFHARLLRCRALAVQGHHVAAVALAQRLSSRVESWFSDDDANTRTAAIDALRALRADLLQQLAAIHEKEDRATLADQYEAEARKLLRDLSIPLPPDRWLSLTETIAGCPPMEESDAPDEADQP
jgi:hypothetical protein